MPLRQRTALITGGTRGIGKGIAQGLAAEGVRIALSYRSNKTAAQNALRQLQALGAECFAVQADAANAEQVEILLKTVMRPGWEAQNLPVPVPDSAAVVAARMRATA